MRFGPLLPCLVLLGAPLGAETSTPPIQPGAVHFKISHGSAFRVAVRRVVPTLCDEALPLGEGSQAGGIIIIPNVRSRCLTVNNAGILDLNEQDDDGDTSEGSGGTTILVPTAPSSDGSTAATVSAHSWHLKGSELLSSACGRWSYEATLDPAVSPSPSSLTLWPAAGDPSRGVFAGTMSLSAFLHLENVDLGLTWDLPLELEVPLRGSWAVPPLASNPSQPQAVSPLLLYAWPGELWWMHRPGCWVKVEEEDGKATYCDRCIATDRPDISGSPPLSMP